MARHKRGIVDGNLTSDGVEISAAQTHTRDFDKGLLRNSCSEGSVRSRIAERRRKLLGRSRERESSWTASAWRESDGSLWTCPVPKHGLGYKRPGAYLCPWIPLRGVANRYVASPRCLVSSRTKLNSWIVWVSLSEHDYALCWAFCLTELQPASNLVHQYVYTCI